MASISRTVFRFVAVAAVVGALAFPRTASADIDKEELAPHADLIAKMVLERIRLQCFVKRSEPHKPASCPRNTWMTGGGVEVLPPEPTASGKTAKISPVISSRPTIEGGATERGNWSCLTEAGKPPPTTVPATAAESLRSGEPGPPPAGVMCYAICCELVETKAPQPRSRRKAPRPSEPAPETAPSVPPGAAAPAPGAPAEPKP